MIILEATGLPNKCCADLRNELMEKELPTRLASHADVLIERAVHALVKNKEEPCTVLVKIDPERSFYIEIARHYSSKLS